MHILITGASSGIGEALARQFGSDPINQITLVARRLENLEALASELSAQLIRCVLTFPFKTQLREWWRALPSDSVTLTY